MNKIIGMTGKRRAGKDTAAKVLVEQGYELVKFAGALKEMIHALLHYAGVSNMTIDRMIEGDLKEMVFDLLGGKSCRFLMQTLGTEWGRETIDQDLWVDICKARCGQFEKVVISDCRFHNEVDVIHSLGGKVIRIVRPGLDNIDTHISESGVDDLPYDYLIINNGTIAALNDKVIEMVKHYE